MVRKRRRHKPEDSAEEDKDYFLEDYWSAKGKASTRRSTKQKKYEEKKSKMKARYDRDWN